VKTLKKILIRVLTTRMAWPVLICVGLLCATSLFALQLADPVRATKQQIWLLIGAAVVFASLLPHYNFLGRIAYGLYTLTILLLVAVLFAPQVAYTHRWFVLPGGTQLQPSELAKIAFVLVLAWHLRYSKNIRTLHGLVWPFLLALIPFALILIEPDLGTAIMFPLVLYAMLLAAGARLRHLFTIALIAVLAMPGAYPFLRTYQQQRIISQIKEVAGYADETHRSGPGYQAYHSQIAIASGGPRGSGGGGGEGAKPIQQGLLPEAYTDFIFAVVGSEWGFMGCALVILFYLGFLAASVEIASSTHDLYARLLVIGLACTILFQAIINMNMTVGIIPVVGVALPFVSYGGSSLLTSLLAVGLLLNVSVRRN
jgi:cell division protein FtsW (lipid II flippase)